jgi:hypothetical protein
LVVDLAGRFVTDLAGLLLIEFVVTLLVTTDTSISSDQLSTCNEPEYSTNHDSSSRKRLFDSSGTSQMLESIYSFHDDSSFDIHQGYGSYRKMQKKASTVDLAGRFVTDLAGLLLIELVVTLLVTSPSSSQMIGELLRCLSMVAIWERNQLSCVVEREPLKVISADLV